MGNGEFVEELLLEAEKREKETLRLSRRLRGLDEPMREMVKGEGIEEGGLQSWRRGKEVIRVRRMGYPGVEAARHLGVITSAANRLAALEESREVLKYVQVSSEPTYPSSSHSGYNLNRGNPRLWAGLVKYSLQKKSSKTPFLFLQEMGFHFILAIGHPLG